jgi:hypothetical protein
VNSPYQKGLLVITASTIASGVTVAVTLFQECVGEVALEEREEVPKAALAAHSITHKTAEAPYQDNLVITAIMTLNGAKNAIAFYQEIVTE